MKFLILIAFSTYLMNGNHPSFPAAIGKIDVKDSALLSLRNPKTLFKLNIDKELSNCFNDVRIKKRSSKNIISLQFTIKNYSEETLTIGVFVEKCWLFNKEIQISSHTIPGFKRADAYKVDSLRNTVELNSIIEKSISDEFFKKSCRLKFSILNKKSIQSENSGMIIKNVKIICELMR